MSDLQYRLREPIGHSGVTSEDAHALFDDLRIEAADHIGELEKERDEALDRCDQLELEADTISAEFEKELWVNLRPVIEECGCDWRDHPDGMSAEDAVTYIRECLDALEHDEERARIRVHELERELDAVKADAEALTNLFKQNPSALWARAATAEKLVEDLRHDLRMWGELVKAVRQMRGFNESWPLHGNAPLAIAAAYAIALRRAEAAEEQLASLETLA